jgi:hypothetical protein
LSFRGGSGLCLCLVLQYGTLFVLLLYEETELCLLLRAGLFKRAGLFLLEYELTLERLLLHLRLLP